MPNPTSFPAEFVYPIELEDLSYRKKANCTNKDPNIFFSSDKATIRRALVICSTCRVKRECAEDAIIYGGKVRQRGIWGGLKASQRVNIIEYRVRNNIPFKRRGARKIFALGKRF